MGGNRNGEPVWTKMIRVSWMQHGQERGKGEEGAMELRREGNQKEWRICEYEPRNGNRDMKKGQKRGGGRSEPEMQNKERSNTLSRVNGRKEQCIERVVDSGQLGQNWSRSVRGFSPFCRRPEEKSKKCASTRSRKRVSPARAAIGDKEARWRGMPYWRGSCCHQCHGFLLQAENAFLGVCLACGEVEEFWCCVSKVVRETIANVH